MYWEARVTAAPPAPLPAGENGVLGASDGSAQSGPGWKGNCCAPVPFHPGMSVGQTAHQGDIGCAKNLSWRHLEDKSFPDMARTCSDSRAPAHWQPRHPMPC